MYRKIKIFTARQLWKKKVDIFAKKVYEFCFYFFLLDQSPPIELIVSSFLEKLQNILRIKNSFNVFSGLFILIYTFSICFYDAKFYYLFKSLLDYMNLVIWDPANLSYFSVFFCPQNLYWIFLSEIWWKCSFGQSAFFEKFGWSKKFLAVKKYRLKKR